MERTPRAVVQIPQDSTYTCYPAVTGMPMADDCRNGEQPQLVAGVRHVGRPAKSPSLSFKPMGHK